MDTIEPASSSAIFRRYTALLYGFFSSKIPQESKECRIHASILAYST